MSDKGSRSNNSIHSNVNISDRGVRMVNMVMETAVNGGAWVGLTLSRYSSELWEPLHSSTAKGSGRKEKSFSSEQLKDCVSEWKSEGPKNGRVCVDSRAAFAECVRSGVANELGSRKTHASDVK
jgi:hypothetical protein